MTTEHKPQLEKARFSNGVALRLLLSFALLASLPVVAGFVGWKSSNAIHEPLMRIASTTVAFGQFDRGFREQSRQLNALYAEATAFESRERFNASQQQIHAAVAGMRRNLEGIAHSSLLADGSELLPLLRIAEQAILQTLERSEQRLTAAERERQLNLAIGATSEQIAELVASEITGLEGDGADAADLVGRLNLLRYETARLANFGSESITSSPDETSNSVDFATTLRTTMQAARQLPAETYRQEVSKLLARIAKLSVESGGLFEVTRSLKTFRIEELESHRLARRSILQIVDMLGEIDARNEGRANELLTAAAGALRNSEWAWLGVGAACTALALLVMLVFVQGNVLRRLNGLTASTHRLNSGQLEQPVPVEGADELSALGMALESFRQNALALRRNERVLQERTRALEQLNRELDQFAYVASHDLKAPMRAIDSLAGFLREDLGDKVDGDSARHLDLMQGRIRRLEALLDSLLEYSRAGRQRAPCEVVNLRETIEASIDLVSPQGVQVRYSGGFGRVSTCKTPFEQIVRNLADNAFKHGSEGQVFLSVECDVVNDQVRLVIADDGPGIEPQFHERVFGMFQTLRPRDKVEGSGMGLAILKKLVDTYGGSISLESNPATQPGTSFTVFWPVDAVLPAIAGSDGEEPLLAAFAKAG